MRKRSEDEWRSLFAAHRASGLSANAFCRQQGLCSKYFSLRRQQLEDEPGPALAEKKELPAFVPVSIKGRDVDMIRLKLNDAVECLLPVSVSPQWLGALLSALRGSPDADV